jgi:uncharacterized lipoprotein YehR (DUF1307 family)
MAIDRVSFVCPYCITVCGWNEKKKTYDAEQIGTDDEKTIQYAHRSCLERKHNEQE